MNFKTTGLLLGLLIIIGAVWLFSPKAEMPAVDVATPAGQPAEPQYVLDPRPEDDEFVRVEVVRPGKPRMVFERNVAAGPHAGHSPQAQTRDSDEWRMVEPLAAPVEQHTVLGLARMLTGLQSRFQFEAGAKDGLTAAEAGLEPPSATITLLDKDGKRLGFEIGKKAVMSNDTYVRVAGENTVHVAMRDLRPQIQKDVNEYRSRYLARFNLNDAVRIRIEQEEQTCDFSRGADGEWVINEPLRAHADRAKIREKLLTRLNSLRAAEFVDDAPESLARYGLEDPFLTLTLTTETRRELPPPEGEDAEEAQPQVETVTETHRVVVGGFADLKSERRYVQTDDGPWVVSVAQSDINNLIPNLNELRDPRVTRVKAADITELELTLGDTTATLRKVDGVWQGTGELAQLETTAVLDLLDAFEALSAISHVDQPEEPVSYGLDQPRAVLKATAAGSLAPVTLRIGSDTPSGRNTYVQHEGEPTVIVTSAAQAARLAISPLALRSREIFTFPVERLTRLQVQRDPMKYELARDGDEWKFTVPADAPVHAASVRALTTDLSRLRAGSVVGRNDDVRFGLDRPTVAVRFEVRAAPPGTTQPTTAQAWTVEHTLRIAWKDDTAYARKDDDPYVFELDETVYGVMAADLIDPRLFTFDADEVVRVKVAATGGTLELAKDGDRWEYLPDPFVALSQKKVRDFVDDLAHLRVQTYLAYRDGDLPAAGLVATPASLTIGLADGREFVINMTQQQPGELPRHAALVAERRIFLLRAADCEKLLRGLDEYVEAE